MYKTHLPKPQTTQLIDFWAHLQQRLLLMQRSIWLMVTLLISGSIIYWSIFNREQIWWLVILINTVR